MSPLYPVRINKNILGILKKLTDVSSSMVFRKEGENVVLKLKGSSMAAMFSTSLMNFDFQGEEIGFADFKNFVDHLDTFKEDGREIKQDALGNLEIRNGRFSLKYRTSDTRILKKFTFNKIDDDSRFVVEFLLTKGDLSVISNASRKLKPDEVKINFSEDGGIKIHLVNTKTYTSFEMELERKARTFDVGTVVLNPNVFQIPENDYELGVSENGRCVLATLESDYRLSFLCGLKQKIAPKAIVEENQDVEEGVMDA